MQRLRDRQKHQHGQEVSSPVWGLDEEGAARSKADKGLEPIRSRLQGLGGTDAQGMFRLLPHSRCHLLFSHLSLYLPHPLHARPGQTPTPWAYRDWAWLNISTYWRSKKWLGERRLLCPRWGNDTWWGNFSSLLQLSFTGLRCQQPLTVTKGKEELKYFKKL